MVGALFPKTKTPANPAPPPAAPRVTDPATQAAAAAEQFVAKQAAGRNSTIFTGPQAGAAQPVTTTKKILLGA